MRLEILRGREIGLVGRDDGEVELVSEIEQLRLDRPLLRQAVTLKLHIEPVAEDGMKRFYPRAGELGITVGERRIDRSFKPAGECDQAFGPRREIADGRNRLARFARREINLGRKAHEIGVALGVLDEKPNAPVGAGAVQIAVSSRALALGGETKRKRQACDRLDAGFRERLGEFQRAEEIVGVGQPERGRTVGGRQRSKLLNRERAFKQRIGGVHPKMHKGLSPIRHALRPAPER